MDYRFQIASDIRRDGLGVELTDAGGNVLAEVFRCEADKSFTVSLFSEELLFGQIEALVRMAREELVSFEDGTPLPDPLAPED